MFEHPKYRGLRFERTASAAFRDASYAQAFYAPPLPLWKRIVQHIKEILS